MEYTTGSLIETEPSWEAYHDNETHPSISAIDERSGETDPLISKTHPSATPLPKVQIAALLFVFLPESVTSTLIYPFVVQLVRSLHIVKGRNPASVGYYTGLIESSFFLTEAIFVSIWAHLSDRVGRKPILLFGSLGLVCALISFGYSTTLAGVLVSRAMQGVLNGNIGVARAMLTELTDSTNRDQAFSFTPVVWASGSTLGPLVGGLLARPSDRFPLFRNEFWQRHPYLLPCLAAAILSLCAFMVTVFCIHEVSHPSYGTIQSIEPTSNSRTEGGDHPNSPITRNNLDADEEHLSILLTPRLLRVLINHALLALLEHSYLALVALFYATPIETGGLGLSPSKLGLLLGTIGLTHGILQPFCFSPLYRTFHPKNLYTTCLAASILAYICFPVINTIARAKGNSHPAVWVIVVIQSFLLLPSYTAFSAMHIFISNAAPSPGLIGTTMGVSQTLFSAMGIIGPSGTTSLFAISQEKKLLGGNLIYVVMCIAVSVAVFTSHFSLPDDSHEETTHRPLVSRSESDSL
ncbi:hypothetical protein M422DRAFT_236419 [Sphaerobolus stellatus SS14]|uniref:Major facilitator superfamily (MFS) profile domain-containing protein n=1 Tax=Sphaerobolus stellatus (strain SS14) TaxID=990650 RepID=A0A0C9TXW9_SPHS4|nr:hypothetical protein M422DRAFT_236419 [Sphaerobolus stellatus SS14]